MTDLDDHTPALTHDDAPPADEAYAGIPVDQATGEVHDDAPDELFARLLAAIAATQEEQQEQQQQRLADLEDMLKAVPDGPWNWAHLTGPERQELWERLYEWVCWLEDRYLRNLFPTRGIVPEWPADWYRHPVAVEMLTALMVAHAAAYREKASPPSFALVEWHERCLWPTSPASTPSNSGYATTPPATGTAPTTTPPDATMIASQNGSTPTSHPHRPARRRRRHCRSFRYLPGLAGESEVARP